MHDTVRKWLEMGSKDGILIAQACRPEKKLGPGGVKFQCFSNLSSQISVLVKVTASILLNIGQRNSPPLPDA